MVSPAKYCLHAQHMVHEIGVIVDLIHQHIAEKALGTKIDVFFYIDSNRKARKLLADMQYGADDIETLYREFVALETSLKEKWQNDFRLIATPVSMHEYFMSN